MAKQMLIGLACACVLAQAARPENPGAETLAGVTNIAILVEPFKAELAQKGLTAAQVTRDIESQFRLAGVPVAEQTAGGTPFLHVQVSATPVSAAKDQLYAYHVAVSFQQFVFLRRNDKLAVAATWRDGATGSIGSADVRSLRDVVRALVTRFLRDFKAANLPGAQADPAGGTATQETTRRMP